MDAKKKRPAKIELGDKELLIVWKDGHQSRFSLAELRKTCPCATCRAQREEPGVQAPAPGELPLLSEAAVKATAAALSFDYVGRYGIRINWADGHNYGIYTFEALQAQEEAGG